MEEARNRGETREDVGTSRKNKVLLHRLKDGAGPSLTKRRRKGGMGRRMDEGRGRGGGRKRDGGMEGLLDDHKSSVNTHDSS